MVSIDAFYKQWNGNLADFDKAYGAQCFDLFQFYNRDIIGAQPAWYEYAYQLYTVFDGDLPNYYQRLPYTPALLPQQGDVVIWSDAFNNMGGHVSIATGNSYPDHFTSFDQNWPIGSAPHIQDHNYGGVLGVLRPFRWKNQAPQEKTMYELKPLARDVLNGEFVSHYGRLPTAAETNAHAKLNEGIWLDGKYSGPTQMFLDGFKASPEALSKRVNVDPKQITDLTVQLKDMLNKLGA